MAGPGGLEGVAGHRSGDAFLARSRPWKQIAEAAQPLGDDDPHDEEGVEDYVAIALAGVQGTD